MSSPAVTRIRQLDTHRLIPSKDSEGGESVLVRIVDDNDHLRGIFDLDHATDDRLLAENDRLPGLSSKHRKLRSPGTSRSNSLKSIRRNLHLMDLALR